MRTKMRKPFATMMVLVLILGSILPAAQPVSARAAPAYAPPPPTQPAPAPPPAGPGVAGQPLPTPPPPDDLPPEAEEARARQAIEAVLGKYLRYWGPRYQVAPVEVTIEGEWAHGVGQWQSQARTLEEPIHILAHRLPDGTWQALMPGTDGLYLQWVDAVPESLTPADEKGQLRTQAAEADALRRAVKPSMIITPTTPSLRPPLPSEPLGPLAPAPTPVPRPRPETWIAEETSISRLSQEERTRLCGVPAEVIEWERLQASRDIAEPEAVYDYPSSVDWRNASGQDYTTDIRNQGGCGSCVAFGTAGAIESRMEIANGDPGLNPDLSEAHLFFCGCGECCGTGWWPSTALNFARDTGVVDEGCYPYTDHDQSCNPCSDWQSRVDKIASWTGTNDVAEMKQSLADYGPFEATMAVYDDFFSYTGGTYRHTWGNLAGYHAITIVGYDDSGGYWIAKNSWGTGWGESGWFRIAYGECGIDDYAYVPDINPPSSCNPNADQIALFVGANYNGQCIVRDVGQYPNPGAVGLPNDSISSIRVGSNVQGILCQHDNYEGICETFAGDDPDLSDNSIGNDQASSVQVEQRSSPCDPTAGQVALYADTGYDGDCVTLDIGDYPNPGYLGSLGNDSAESIKVGSNVQATLCEHDDYQGRCETFTGDDSNLGDNYIGANVVSSVRIQSRDTTPPTGQITVPSDGAVINTCPLTIQAEASDDQSGVSRVEFHTYYDSDWHHVGDDYTSPYSWNWDCSSVSDQGVWLTIHVWDNAGNEIMDPGGYVYITLSSPTIGPLVYNSHTVDDDNNDQSSGDGDGVVECGETIELYVALYNQGDGTATGVNATISTSDPYVTWLYNTSSSYPDISGGGTEINSSDFDFTVDPSTPDGHVIHFDLDVIASNGGPWADSFDVPVTCVSCNDPHESNDTPGQATPISYGATLSDPDICPAGDVDYYAFAGSAGDTIVADVDAQASGSTLDSYLYLYNTDGVTELAHNDDYDGLDSRIAYVLPADGTYYLMVREYNHPNEGGPDYFYAISLVQESSFDVDASWTSSAPTVDGQISAGEWDDAAAYDITDPGVQAQRGPDAEALPEALLGGQNRQRTPSAPESPLSTVTLYAMNDGTHLYLAIDNPNDATGDTYDQIGVYFDDNPLPSDGLWTHTTCGHADGEGNFWALTSTVEYREWISGPATCDLVVPAPGTAGAVGHGSGHAQAEIVIDLTSSALRATPGDATNMYLWIYDAARYTFDGVWPITADFQVPSTYRPLTLAAGGNVGPLVYDGLMVDDDTTGQSSGDGDGVVECGETIELYVDLYNQGDSTAIGVNATISTSDPYVTWLYNTSSDYPDISGGDKVANYNDFDFAVDASTPDGHVIHFGLDVTASNGGPWADSFSVSVACTQPDLVPSQWGGWQYPIVPSSITGTNVVNTLYAGYLTYIDWGISNSGDADCGGDAYGDLYIDDILLAQYNFGNVLAGWT